MPLPDGSAMTSAPPEVVSRAALWGGTTTMIDFAARMDWSITPNYAEANHHPIAVVNGNKTRSVLEVTAAPGSKVNLNADGSSDPDSDHLSYRWSYYQEPSNYNGTIEIQGDSESTASVLIPSNASGKNIHIILELTDDGSPNLYAYRRVIVYVQ